MKDFNVVFTIISKKNCPLYQEGERFFLSERTLSCPEGKEACLILVRDMTQLLFTFLKSLPFDPKEYLSDTFNCSGCSGLIKFALINPEDEKLRGQGEGVVAPIESAIEKLRGRGIASPFFDILPEEKTDIFLDQVQEILLEENSILISQGRQNINLYFLIEGELALEDNGVLVTTLNEGELCGEMSYLGSDLAVATVRALSASKVLAIEGKVFAALLGDNLKVQVFMAQLLAKRIRKVHAAKGSDFESCMSGRIDEILPAELLQIFHMHQKTGVLSLELEKGSAHVSFREGCIINAGYEQLINQEAIFRILAEQSGLYRFTTGLSPEKMKAAEIGDFMMLLMEGVKRADEGKIR